MSIVSGMNLLSVIRDLGVHENEIPHAIHNHFGSSGYEADSMEVCYPGTSACEIKIVYSKHGTVNSVVAGPNLTEDKLNELLEQIRLNFASDGSIAIGRYVLFTLHPIHGFWRYKDRFQIAPLPADAPRPPFAIGEHPSLLEFRYPTVKDFSASGVRCATEAQHLVWILNALVGHSVAWESPKRLAALFSWMLSKKGPNLQTCYLQHGYFYPNLSTDQNDFTSVDEFNPIPTNEPQRHYQTHLSAGEHLRIPADLGNLFDEFFALSQDAQDKFLCACYWLATANNTSSRSLKLIAAVQAIESLRPKDSGEKKAVCEKCNKDLGPGPTRKFREFLSQYAPLAHGEKDNRDELYRVRSWLTHGDNPPFRVDMMMEWAMNPQGERQERLLGDGLRTVHIALRNWLSGNRPPVIDRKESPSRIRSVMARSGEAVIVDGERIERNHASPEKST